MMEFGVRLWRGIFTRRSQVVPVEYDQRRRNRAREAQAMLEASIARLNAAVDSHSNGNGHDPEPVQWIDFYRTCEYGIVAGNGRLCRNPDHPGGSPAFCVEDQCPILHKRPTG